MEFLYMAQHTDMQEKVKETTVIKLKDKNVLRFLN